MSELEKPLSKYFTTVEKIVLKSVIGKTLSVSPPLDEHSIKKQYLFWLNAFNGKFK